MKRKNPIEYRPGNLIPGYHAVREALMHGKIPIRELWIAEGKPSARILELVRIARAAHIPVFTKKSAELSELFPGLSHQKVAALSEGFVYSDLDPMVRCRPPHRGLLIALDHITDEGNLGSIIRTAVFFGAHGIILPKDRSAGVTAGVIKRSAGLSIHLPIAKVVNLARALDRLKKEGFWIIGASGAGRTDLYEFDWNREVVLVLGNEQRGLTPSVQKKCDQLVSIPPCGPAESLNVAVAGGVILSEIIRQRKTGQGPRGQKSLNQNA